MTQDHSTPPTTGDESTPEHQSVQARVLDFAAVTMVALGLGALGFGTGVHVSLMNVQAAVFKAGELSLQMQVSTDLYNALKLLQTYANTSLYAAAILLIGGAFIGERENVKRQIEDLATHLEDDSEVSDDA